MKTPPVFLLGNAMTPGAPCPSAAPGLRAYGLKAGLAANGVPATILLQKEMVERQLDRWRVPLESRNRLGDVQVVENDRIMDYLVEHAPATVIATNWAGTAPLEKHPLLRIGLDFFSPTALEHRYRDSNVDSVIRNKEAAIELADFYFVNGARRIAYCYGWLAASGLDLREVKVPAINMSLPFAFLPQQQDARHDRIRINVTGYNQPWAPLAPVLTQLESLVVRFPNIEVDVVAAADYWNLVWDEDPLNDMLRRLSDHPQFRILPPMDYQRLGETLREADFIVDLFEHNIEREYSMSTRAIVALAHGVPVVHPGFTELGSLIREFSAGWTEEAGVKGYAGLVDRAVHEIMTDPDLLRRKKEAARHLAQAHFNPVTETKKLLPLLGRSAAANGPHADATQ